MNKLQQSMPAEKVLTLRSDLLKLGVDPIIDGGWGIDALLGKQTREHKDLDIIIEKKDVENVRAYFANQGYKPADDESMWWHFALSDGTSEVDVFVIEITANGDGVYGPPERNMPLFPASALAGAGVIAGAKVRTLSADYRLLCLTRAFGVVTKTDYAITKKDYLDLDAISKKFNLPMPEEFLEARESLGIN